MFRVPRAKCKRLQEDPMIRVPYFEGTRQDTVGRECMKRNIMTLDCLRLMGRGIGLLKMDSKSQIRAEIANNYFIRFLTT